jgi:hypothetical protein
LPQGADAPRSPAWTPIASGGSRSPLACSAGQHFTHDPIDRGCVADFVRLAMDEVHYITALQDSISVLFRSWMVYSGSE